MIKVYYCSHKVLRKLGSSSPRGESGGSVRSVLQFQTELAVPEVDKTRGPTDSLLSLPWPHSLTLSNLTAGSQKCGEPCDSG